jgi:uncharacterized protein YecE (DUF72 family)
MAPIRIGTAGWSIPKDCADAFPVEGSGLQRYSAVFSAAEINSSFHRPHRTSTWEKWRDSVPGTFRFSAKLPKTITHDRRLVNCEELLPAFVEQVALLKDKLAILLIQLPPSLEWDAYIVRTFLRELATRIPTQLACEPRHPSWFDAEADALLAELRVARVAADPALVPGAAEPGGWSGLRYWRLHGSPIMYRSSYADRIDSYASLVAKAGPDCWCIFDNTASSAATRDALALSAAHRGNASRLISLMAPEKLVRKLSVTDEG